VVRLAERSLATIVGLLVLNVADRSIRPFGVVVVGGRCCA